jgi:hypothetical protein
MNRSLVTCAGWSLEVRNHTTLELRRFHTLMASAEIPEGTIVLRFEANGTSGFAGWRVWAMQDPTCSILEFEGGGTSIFGVEGLIPALPVQG